MPGELIIGLMSGTSVDGIDATLVQFSSVSELTLEAQQFTPFEDSLRSRINELALSKHQLLAQDYAELELELAKAYAAASLSLIEQSDYIASEISAIANHGQTVRHEPPYSLQLGNNQALADLTGIATIAQFRQGDLALGGQGAPLMPAFHQAVFNHAASKQAIILNLGGIANLTRLGEPVVGFDIGPANALMDQWIGQCKQLGFDKDGAWASSGQADSTALNKLLSDPYFALAFPKSTGPDYFNLDWLRATLGDLSQFKAADLQATLLALTVESVALSIEQLNIQQAVIYVCGGGAQNSALMQGLEQRLENCDVTTTDSLGVDADWVESIGFAWLGYCHLHGINSNQPSVTGASEATVLGKQYTPQNS